MGLIFGILCLFIAFQGYMVMDLMKRVSKIEDVLKSMNHDLNIVNKTMSNSLKMKKEKEEVTKVILKG